MVRVFCPVEEFVPLEEPPHAVAMRATSAAPVTAIVERFQVAIVDLPSWGVGAVLADGPHIAGASSLVALTTRRL
jgi:hypothetical protein